MHELYGFGLGVGTTNSKNAWLEVFYPTPLLKPGSAFTEVVSGTLGYDGGNQAITLDQNQLEQLAEALTTVNPEQAELARRLQNSTCPTVATLLRTDRAPSSVPEGYLKLHFLSHRLVKPHQTNLTGLFNVLPTVAWTNQGAIDLADLPERQFQARLSNHVLEVGCVDKFPKMSNYVVPTAVRIAHTARVRLGAYLGEGTTVMHEGFVNFNAGTEGPGIIEGRISAGVMIGAGSDLGGSSSTVGTLASGDSIGKECLIGANAGVGIPLGDRCIVEAGLYVTAGTKVALLDSDGELVKHVKARDLARKSDLLFWRNSQTGAVECKINSSPFEAMAELEASF